MIREKLSRHPRLWRCSGQEKQLRNPFKGVRVMRVVTVVCYYLLLLAYYQVISGSSSTTAAPPTATNTASNTRLTTTRITIVGNILLTISA